MSIASSTAVMSSENTLFVALSVCVVFICLHQYYQRVYLTTTTTTSSSTPRADYVPNELQPIRKRDPLTENTDPGDDPLGKQIHDGEYLDAPVRNYDETLSYVEVDLLPPLLSRDRFSN